MLLRLVGRVAINRAGPIVRPIVRACVQSEPFKYMTRLLSGMLLRRRIVLDLIEGLFGALLRDFGSSC
jgi:hypothetical protein